MYVQRDVRRGKGLKNCVVFYIPGCMYVRFNLRSSKASVFPRQASMYALLMHSVVGGQIHENLVLLPRLRQLLRRETIAKCRGSPNYL